MSGSKGERSEDQIRAEPLLRLHWQDPRFPDELDRIIWEHAEDVGNALDEPRDISPAVVRRASSNRVITRVQRIEGHRAGAAASPWMGAIPWPRLSSQARKRAHWACLTASSRRVMVTAQQP